MTKNQTKESNSSHTTISQDSDNSVQDSQIIITPIINLSPKNKPKAQYEKVKKWLQSQITKNSKQRRYKNSKSNKNKKKMIKRGQWSLQENKLLKNWIAVNGAKNWEACGRYIQGRTGKQCREHWNNCLNPELIKGDWTPEEDFLIMFFYEKCQGSWKKINPLFNGRIENSIKNRFYSQLRKYATQNMNCKQRKELCPKIKLIELKKYLNKALSETKKVFLKKSKMTKEQFNNFLIQNELKLKDNLSESNDTNEGNLSINLGDSLFNEKNNGNNNININLNKKRKRDDNIIFDKDDNENQNFDFSFDEKSFDALWDDNEKKNDMNDIDINKDIYEPNNDFNLCNDIDTNINNNILDINEENKNDISMDCIEIIQKDNYRNLFKEYNYEQYLYSNSDKNININIDLQNYSEGFKFAFENSITI